MRLNNFIGLSLLGLLIIPVHMWALETAAVGLRIQKTPNLYYENGISFDYHLADFMKGRVHFGATYTSSRLGSALGSNALNQDNILLSSSLVFRLDKKLMPLMGLNLGYFMVDMESDIFSMLPSTSLLLSLEFGIVFPVTDRVSVRPTLGYNLITGDGINGPGTLYPIFLNLTTFYHLKGVQR